MQCVNCQFNNMPGTQSCARCGSSLTLASSAIEVHPPRAGSVALRVRRWLPMQQMFFSMRDRWETDVRSPLQSYVGKMPELAVLARMVVPGWSQLYLGQRWLGRTLLWSWLGFLVLGLLLFGTTRGSFLLGMAFSIHSFAASDLLNRSAGDRSIGAQIVRSIVVSILLAICLYGPAAFALTRVADAVNPAYNIGPFDRGDTLLVNHWTTPGPGSVVLYDIPYYQATPRAPAGHERLAGFTGQRVDRIIAGPGEVIECRRGVLLINHAVARHAPLSFVKVPDFAPFTLSEDMVFILPSTAPDLGFAESGELFLQMSVVQMGRVRGVVYARLHPLSRFRLIF